MALLIHEAHILTVIDELSQHWTKASIPLSTRMLYSYVVLTTKIPKPEFVGPLCVRGVKKEWLAFSARGLKEEDKKKKKKKE